MCKHLLVLCPIKQFYIITSFLYALQINVYNYINNVTPDKAM